MTSLKSLTVSTSSVLKISSRSTAETVSAWLIVSPSLDLLGVAGAFGRKRELHLAPGDRRERALANRRGRAAWKRCEVFVHRERHQRLAVRAKRDLLDGARREPSDDDLVAGDELARVLELGRDLVVVVTPHEHDEEHRDGDDRERRQRLG